MSPSPVKEQIVKATAWNAFGQFTGQAMRVLVLFLLARLLSKEDFGLVAMANLLVTFLTIFSNNGFSEAVIQRKTLDEVSCDTAFWTLLSMGVLLAVLCCASAPLVSHFFAAPQLTTVTMVLSLSFVIGGCSSMMEALLRREMDFKTISIRFTAGRLAGGAIGIFGAWKGWGVWSLVVMQLTEQTVGALLLWVKVPYRPGFRFSRAEARSYFSFGLNITGVQLFGYFKDNIDQIVIGRLLGPELLGAYAVMRRLVFFVYGTLNTIYIMVFYSVYCRIRDEAEELRGMFYKGVKFISLTCYPFLLLCIFFHAPIVRLALGVKWVPWSALAAIICLPVFFDIIFWNQHILYTAIGRPSVRLFLTMIPGIISIPIVIFGSHWGVYGVAWAFAGATLLCAPINFITANRVCGCTFSKTIQAVFFPTLLAALSFGLGFASMEWLNVEGGVLVYFIIAVSCLIFAGLVALTERENLRFFISLLRKKNTAVPAAANNG